MGKKKKKQKSRSKQSPGSAITALVKGLQRAEQLMNQADWDQAQETLLHLNQRHPNQFDVLYLLMAVAYEQQDMQQYQQWGEQLHRLDPDNPETTAALMGAYLTNGRPALGLRTARYFLERWPDDEEYAPEVRRTVAEVEPMFNELLTNYGLTGDEAFEVAAMHEEVMSLSEQGKFTRARERAQELLKLRPDFTPAYNNISQAYFAEGEIEQAMATARQVLSFAPDNYHALSNLTRYLCLTGNLDEAQEWAERLKAVESDDSDVWVKKMEALSFLGDDEGIMDAFQGAERSGVLRESFAHPLLYHLTAVAALRLGNEKKARHYWQHALKQAPWLELARTNLDDLQQPVGERHAPWPFRLGEWFASERFNRMASSAQRATQGKSGKASTRALQEWLEANPDIIALIPLLLDRGDPQGREFAFRTAMAAELPELNVALRDFALGQRGPDSMRHQAATAANEAGLLPSGGIRLWLKGEWQDIMLMSFEISGEPDLRGHSPEVSQLAEDATLALHDKDYETAEGLIRQALELEPDAPDLQNNLAVAYSMSGRTAEAEELVKQIHQQHPDYFFARLSVARIHIRNGEIEQAQELVKPLLSRKKFHTSEFTQLCDVEAELWIADGKPDAARAWLDLWADVEPDNPQLASRRRQLEGTSLLQNLEKLVGRFK